MWPAGLPRRQGVQPGQRPVPARRGRVWPRGRQSRGVVHPSHCKESRRDRARRAGHRTRRAAFSKTGDAMMLIAHGIVCLFFGLIGTIQRLIIPVSFPLSQRLELLKKPMLCEPLPKKQYVVQPRSSIWGIRNQSFHKRLYAMRMNDL